MSQTYSYTIGDWIVHSKYGIGQIEKLENKKISGEKSAYYRIQSGDSTFWVPADKMDSAQLRPLAKPAVIQQAIDLLQAPPKKMPGNYKLRQQKMVNAQVRNTPTALARILRDMRAYRRQKGNLSSTERVLFSLFKQRLAEEWALVKNMSAKNTNAKIEDLLSVSTA